jgi:uncharacterized protein (DUF1778 family)
MGQGRSGEIQDKRLTRFKLEERDWNQFVERINRPATVPKGLRSLYSKPGVFK